MGMPWNIHCLWQNSRFINMEYVKLKCIYIYNIYIPIIRTIYHMIWLCLKMMYTWLCYMFVFPCGNGGRSRTVHQIQMEWIGYVRMIQLVNNHQMISMGMYQDPNRWRYVNVPYFWPYELLGIFPEI